jgi:hypothetical protein
MVDFDVVTGPAPPLRLPSLEKPPPRDVEKDASTNPQRNPSPPPGERDG